MSQKLIESFKNILLPNSACSVFVTVVDVEWVF